MHRLQYTWQVTHHQQVGAPGLWEVEMPGSPSQSQVRALHTGLTFGRRETQQPYGLSSWRLWVYPLPYEYLCAQGRNSKQQIKITVKGQDRNPRRNGKVLYLDLQQHIFFPGFSIRGLSFLFCTKSYKLGSYSCFVSPASHKDLQDRLINTVFILGCYALPKIGSSVSMEDEDNGYWSG